MKRLMMFLLTIMIVIGVADVPVQAKNEKWPKGPSAGSITAESAIVMELNTGTILYDKNINPPGEYLKSGKIVDKNAKKWCESSIRKILSNKKINTRGD